MATKEELLTEWYEALWEENSLRVQALLADHPSLLKVGWGDEAPQVQVKEKPWKERTALHVGVKRGNAELVHQVLILCNVQIPKHSRTKERDKGNRPSTNSKDKPDRAEIEVQAQKNDNNIAGSSQDDTPGEGDRQSPKSTLSTTMGKPPDKTGIQTALSSISGSKPDGHDESQEISCFPVAKSKRQVADTRFIEDLSKDRDNSFLRRLLVAKDGEYNLDATAIAALHGNRKIFLLILYAIRKCKLHNVATDSLPALDATEESEEHSFHRVKVGRLYTGLWRSETLIWYPVCLFGLIILS